MPTTDMILSTKNQYLPGLSHRMFCVSSDPSSMTKPAFHVSNVLAQSTKIPYGGRVTCAFQNSSLPRPTSQCHCAAHASVTCALETSGLGSFRNRKIPFSSRLAQQNTYLAT